MAVLASIDGPRALFGGIAAAWAAMRQRTLEIPRLHAQARAYVADSGEVAWERSRRSAQNRTSRFCSVQVHIVPGETASLSIESSVMVSALRNGAELSLSHKVPFVYRRGDNESRPPPPPRIWHRLLFESPLPQWVLPKQQLCPMSREKHGAGCTE